MISGDVERERFQFGGNWKKFLADLDPLRIRNAELSLINTFGATLSGKTFLDIGSGSGIFSLAARRLGATVHSFDSDARSVACTAELRQRFYPGDPHWTVEAGSVLDRTYIESLGHFDFVYAWGVLHHTGALWLALQLACTLPRENGVLLVAVYNDQGWQSRAWRVVKRTYNRLPKGLRWLVLAPSAARLWGPTTFKDLVRLRPNRTWRSYSTNRGMSPWRDLVDWVGGYPFEVARPQEVVDFLSARGLSVAKTRLVGEGLGCNEFMAVREQPT